MSDDLEENLRRVVVESPVHGPLVVRRLNRIVAAAIEVLAVRGKDFERNPLPAYMERPFSVLRELLKDFKQD